MSEPANATPASDREWIGRPVEDWLAHPPGGDADSEWLASVLRFTRADGSPVFGPRGRNPSRLAKLERQIRRADDPSLARVLGWWRPSSKLAAEAGFVAPPLPTQIWPNRPLGVLRPDWTPRGSCLAIDHRTPGSATTIEVAGRGASWLGPTWTSPPLVEPVSPAWATFATTGPFADAIEWSFAAGPVTVTRTAVLIRGAGLALLLQTEEGLASDFGEIRWTLPDGVEARPDPATRAWILSAGRGKPTARLIPLGLPELPGPTDQGLLLVDRNEVILRQRTNGPNRCLSLLVSWTTRPPRIWRTLTVAEKSATCPPGLAFAARVGWGSSQNGLLIYRSLGPTGLRSVLGHQTMARLLIAGFSPTGEVHPWVKDPSRSTTT